MAKAKHLGLMFGLFCVAGVVRAQAEPTEVAACQLAKNPREFDGKLVRVRASLNVAFEDFTLGIANCKSQQGIWLAFGGDVPGVVASTANDNFRSPGSDLKLNGVSYGIRKDDNFRRLYALIAFRHGDRHDYKVTATLTGTFFAGEESGTGGDRRFMGFGHLGCCSLLAITGVSEVVSDPPADLYLRGIVSGPEGRPVEGLTVINDVLGGSPPERQTRATNDRGEFEFFNSGQQLRIENPRYRPLAITVRPGAAPVRVKLENAKDSDWIIRACASSKDRNRVGFSVLFAIPRAIETSRFNNEETQTQSYFVYPRGESATSAELIISHEADKVGEAGNSVDSDQFEERWVKDTAGSVVGIDARGRREDGSYWRTVIFDGHDTARYWLQPGEKPRAADRILDSACLVGDVQR